MATGTDTNNNIREWAGISTGEKKNSGKYNIWKKWGEMQCLVLRIIKMRYSI
jgi:hypothetical protein